eukprot:gene9858-biopygen16752
MLVDCQLHNSTPSPPSKRTLCVTAGRPQGAEVAHVTLLPSQLCHDAHPAPRGEYRTLSPLTKAMETTASPPTTPHLCTKNLPGF